jgi:hypothetical protein
MVRPSHCPCLAQSSFSQYVNRQYCLTALGPIRSRHRNGENDDQTNNAGANSGNVTIRNILAFRLAQTSLSAVQHL